MATGYRDCLYLQSVSSNGIVVKSVMTKSKVAPLNSLIIPKLELCAVVLLCKLVDFYYSKAIRIRISLFTNGIHNTRIGSKHNSNLIFFADNQKRGSGVAFTVGATTGVSRSRYASPGHEPGAVARAAGTVAGPQSEREGSALAAAAQSSVHAARIHHDDGETGGHHLCPA